MTTFYLDLENGNDANDGLSFANRWKTFTNGATAARIAPNDTIRVMGSPNATSLGQTATWTDAQNGANQGSKAIVSSTNATPIVVTVSAANYALLEPTVGGTVIVNGHTTNTNANGVWDISAVDAVNYTVTLVNADGSNSVGNGVGGATGTIRNATNMVVKLGTAVTKNIAVFGNQGSVANWTASANVTSTVVTANATFKEGGNGIQLAIAAGFTTGKAAYFATGTLDLSTYQQIGFSLNQTVGTLGAAASVSLELCTDTAGVTSVHSIPIPLIGALNQWMPVTVNLGTNLNSAIQSIALYVNTDNGAQGFYLSNIIACKAASSADSLNLTSLISKNTTDEAWFAIQSINGTRIMLEGAGTNIYPTASPQRGYAGTTETVTTYKRETIKTPMAAATTTIVNAINDSGTLGNLITFSGGWNRTDMSTQTGVTVIDGQNGLGYAIDFGANSYTRLDKFAFTRYNRGYNGTGTDNDNGDLSFSSLTGGSIIASGGLRDNFGTISLVNCGATPTLGTGGTIAKIARADSNLGVGITCSASNSIGEITQSNNNSSNGVAASINSYIGSILKSDKNASNGYTSANKSVVGYLSANNNLLFGINAKTTQNWSINSGSTSGNASGGVSITTGQGNLNNFTINEATEVSGFTAYSDARVYSQNHDNTANNATVFCDGGLITQQAVVVHGTAPTAWKFSPTSTNRSATYPLNLPIAKIGVNASALVTVSAYLYRDSSNLTGKLVCKGGQIAGVSADVISTLTSAGAWELLTITFTPSAAGVVEIEAQFWGGTTYNGYVSVQDMVITQA